MQIQRNSRDGNIDSHADKKAWRKRIMEKTRDAVQTGGYAVHNPSRGGALWVDIRAMLARTADPAYSKNSLYPSTKMLINLPDQIRQRVLTRTAIKVVNADSIDCAVQMRAQYGLNPVVLNMANEKYPGGGYQNGAGAQEESLFRRSNYYTFLDPSYSESQIAAERFLYPIPPTGGIYSNNVLVFRQNEKNNYEFTPEPFFLSFVAVAAMNRPQTGKDGKLVHDAAELTREKMRTILRIGLNHGHDSIVLGAFGCGAFQNPASHIALLFRELIETEFFGVYKAIYFAVIDDHNSSAGGKNPNGNLHEFRKCFE